VFSLASHLKDIPELLLLRSGLMFIASSADQPGDAEQAVRGFELELAHLGYVASARLRERALAASAAELQQLRDLVIGASFKATGGHRKLEPMFRRFPDDIPEDTRTLWWDRVIVHFLQAPEQPCVLCRRSGTVHVLNPCAHLVCDRCFDGSNYSGCPICNRTVDPSSPFFRPVERGPADRVAAARTFALLDLGNYVADRNMETASSELFRSLCLRTQAMSPVDVDALLALIEAYRGKVLEWVPPRLPVRENTALIFGTSLRIALQAAAGEREPAALSPVAIMRVARHHLSTATDVLRLIAALSGVSVALLPETKITRGDLPDAVKRFGKVSRSPMRVISHHRFKVAKLPRSLRRELLALLDEMPAAQLLEDLDRHHSPGCRSSASLALGVGRRTSAPRRVCEAVPQCGPWVFVFAQRRRGTRRGARCSPAPLAQRGRTRHHPQRHRGGLGPSGAAPRRVCALLRPFAARRGAARRRGRGVHRGARSRGYSGAGVVAIPSRGARPAVASAGVLAQGQVLRAHPACGSTSQLAGGRNRANLFVHRCRAAAPFLRQAGV
jgi:Prokaryotic RING finger family 4